VKEGLGFGTGFAARKIIALGGPALAGHPENRYISHNLIVSTTIAY
jgi:hypothetical protein